MRLRVDVTVRRPHNTSPETKPHFSPGFANLAQLGAADIELKGDCRRSGAIPAASEGFKPLGPARKAGPEKPSPNSRVPDRTAKPGEPCPNLLFLLWRAGFQRRTAERPVSALNHRSGRGAGHRRP